MKYLLTTPDKAKYVKVVTKQITYKQIVLLTFDPKLAMKFKSKREANTFNMVHLSGQFVVVKEGK